MNISFILGRLWVILILLVALPFSAFADQQNYSSMLSKGSTNTADNIDIDLQSHISWGKVTSDYIHLFEIPSSQNGFIEFNIEHTIDVDVTLVSSIDPARTFGFKYLSSSLFSIIVDGEIIDFPFVIGGVSNAYDFNDDFKVEKCGDKIFYFKNQQLVYTYCDIMLEAMFHKTLVNAASATTLTLLFENNSSSCQGPGFTNDGQVGLERTSDNASPIALLAQTLEPKTNFNITLYDQNGKPRRTFRKRTNNSGFLLGQDEIAKHLSTNKYTISILIDKN